MRRYEKYKDCDLGWIKEIPSEWEVTSLKYISEIVNGSTPRDEEKYWDGNIKWLTPSDLGSNNGNKFIYDSRRTITEEGLNSCGCNLVPSNSIILSTRAPIGHVAIPKFEFATNQGCKSIVPSINVSSDFLYYFIVTLRKELEKLGSGSTFMELSTQSLADFKFLVPSLPEQLQIASYLNYKTSLIDDLIAKKRRKIELLKEQHTAIINQAVTKGLNPNAKMKESGVEWIGKIPEHWDTIRSKYLLSEKDGIKIGPFGSALKLDTLADTGIKIYGQANIINDDFTIGKRFLTEKRYNEEFLQYTILPGDLLITMMGTTGKAKIFDSSFEVGIMDSHLIRLRLSVEMINPKFFELLINESSYINNQIKLNSKGSIMEGLNSSIIKEIQIIIPPMNEQNQILDFISEKTSEITQLIETESEEVMLLQEYRQSLISEVVTGKIDVREFMPSTN